MFAFYVCSDMQILSINIINQVRIRRRMMTTFCIQQIFSGIIAQGACQSIFPQSLLYAYEHSTFTKYPILQSRNLCLYCSSSSPSLAYLCVLPVLGVVLLDLLLARPSRRPLGTGEPRAVDPGYRGAILWNLISVAERRERTSNKFKTSSLIRMVMHKR